MASVEVMPGVAERRMAGAPEELRPGAAEKQMAGVHEKLTSEAAGELQPGNMKSQDGKL